MFGSRQRGLFVQMIETEKLLRKLQVQRKRTLAEKNAQNYIWLLYQQFAFASNSSSSVRALSQTVAWRFFSMCGTITPRADS